MNPFGKILSNNVEFIEASTYFLFHHIYSVCARSRDAQACAHFNYDYYSCLAKKELIHSILNMHKLSTDAY